MRNAIVAGLAGTALLVLAGCTNERVVGSEISTAYSRSEVVYAASDRDLQVVLYGAAFAEDPQRFAQRVTEAMKGRIFGINTNPTTTPNQTARRDYKVVLAFNPADTMLSSSLCSSGSVRTLPPGPSVVVQGAFCRSGGTLTSATGWLDKASSADDPDFRQLIADMMYTLFPTRGAEVETCSGLDC